MLVDFFVATCPLIPVIIEEAKTILSINRKKLRQIISPNRYGN
jgi:hypothetical protein